jgi:epoxide hydrolase-like predicted phosphatase
MNSHRRDLTGDTGIKAVIFDLGGVLVRTEFPEVRHQLERRHGFEPGHVERTIWASEDWELAQLGDLSYEEYWKRVGAMLGLASPRETADFRREYFSADRVDQELVQLIEELRPRYKIGLLSNAPDKLDTWLENDWGIAHLFDAVVYSGKVGMVKPDPRIYQLILERLEVQPAEALFVDDYPRNIDAALALGMAAVRFTSTEALKSDLHRYLAWEIGDGGASQ